MNATQVAEWNQELEAKTPREIVLWAQGTFGDGLAQATGLGLEDQIITHLVAQNQPGTPIYFVDTGRHFQQTHDLIQETSRFYGVEIRVHVPHAEELEKLIDTYGPNVFQRSPELRRACCAVRKHDPLARALAPFAAVLTGRRAEQAPHRQDLRPLTWDAKRDQVRIHPLWSWREKQVWDYVRLNGVPTHELHNVGYSFPGCAPCTRAIKPGEPFAAGRWWWENHLSPQPVA